MDRDESVEKLKKLLDDWNARIAEWEQGMNEAQVNMKSRYQEQLDSLRQQREEAMKKLSQIQGSSEAAWGDMSKGFEEAWKGLAEGFENAWSELRNKEQHKNGPKSEG